MPSISIENYLKVVYNMTREGGRVSTKKLAARMGLSQPSITHMMQALHERGLVDYQPYQGVNLKPEGERMAIRIIRRHRLIELFLVKTLDMAWDEVDSEAELLEHAISDLLADRIDRYLGHPQIDPHGSPIPDAHGNIVTRDTRKLSDLGVGDRATVAGVSDSNAEVLRYLTTIGLTLEADLSILGREPFEGPITIETGGKTRAISPSMAARVLVLAR
ncbi:MAG: metal-dependent transcriptional regulator [Planctomycetota bacterium]